MTDIDTTSDAVEHECSNIHDCTILLMIPAMYGQRWQDMLRALLAKCDQLQAQLEKAEAGLTQIAEMKPHHAGQTPNEYHMQEIARDALADFDDAQAALEARDKRVRKEALREALRIVKGWHDCGNKPGDFSVMRAEAEILALVRQDDSMIEGDTDE